MIVAVSGMWDVFSYFPHVLPSPNLSFSLNEFNITEWSLMTVRMHRNRVNVLNYSIISCLYIKKQQHTCRKNVSLVWTVVLNYQSTVVFCSFYAAGTKQSFLNSGKHRFCKEMKWWPFSPIFLRPISISLVHFYCAGWWLHMFLTYFTGGVSSTIRCKILSIYVLFIQSWKLNGHCYRKQSKKQNKTEQQKRQLILYTLSLMNRNCPTKNIFCGFM